MKLLSKITTNCMILVYHPLIYFNNWRKVLTKRNISKILSFSLLKTIKMVQINLTLTRLLLVLTMVLSKHLRWTIMVSPLKIIKWRQCTKSRCAKHFWMAELIKHLAKNWYKMYQVEWRTMIIISIWNKRYNNCKRHMTQLLLF